MIEYLRKDVSIGDTVKLSLTTGKEPEGIVVEVGDNFILLKTLEETTTRYFDKLIGGWEVIKKANSETVVGGTSLEKLPLVVNEQRVDFLPTRSHVLTGPKVVGKIELKDFDVKKNPSKRKRVQLSSFKSFEELKKSIDENTLTEFLPANGEIDRYFSVFKNGSIRSGELSRINFKDELVIDETIKAELRVFKPGDSIPVIISYATVYNKPKTIFVAKPATALDFLEKAKTFAKNGQPEVAYHILTYLIENHVKTDEIIALQKSYNLKLKQTTQYTSETISSNTSLSKSDLSTKLQRSRKLRLEKGFDESESLYLEVIKAGYSIDSAVKELADQYREQGDLKKAIHLVEQHFSKFSKPEPAFNFLYDLYVKNNQFEQAIELSKKALTQLPNSDSKLNKGRRILLLTRLIVLLVKLNRNNEADKYLQEALELDSQNPSIKKLEEIVFKTSGTTSTEEIEALFDENQFITLVFGLSPFLQDALNRCEYDGLTSKVREARNFSKHTLAELRELIRKTKEGQPLLRAKHYLTEAKLLQEVEPANVIDFYSAMAKYCNAMAKVVAAEMGPMDVVREYYLNSFTIQNYWKPVATQVSLYIESIYSSSIQIVMSDGVGVSNAFKQFERFQEIRRNAWDTILELIIASKFVSARILSVVFTNDQLKAAANSFLQSIGISQGNTKVEFVDSWNKAAQKRKSEKESVVNNYSNLCKLEELHDVVTSVLANRDRFNKRFLSELDQSRSELLFEVSDTVQQYLANTKFEDREFYYNSADLKISELLNDIDKYPTSLSLTALKPVLNHLSSLLGSNFNGLIASSKPYLTLSIEGESSVTDEKTCEIQISLINKPESSKAGEIEMTLIGFEEGVSCSNNSHPFSQTLRGGSEPLIAKFKIHVDDNVLKQGATVVKVKVAYKELATGQVHELNENLSVQFFDSGEFQDIPNPYANHAKSNIVENLEMFKGRQELIERISDTILTAKSKGYVIYGQKRSGKSSVLWHLHNKINNSGEALSVFFSLGKSLEQDGSVEVNLYYLILTNIEKVIRQMKLTGQIVPEIGKTDYKEFRSYPSIVFYQRLSEIQEALSNLASWRHKKIVLIIDEFTYLYYLIKKGIIPSTFMQKWKALVEDGSFSVILAGQDTMVKFMGEFQNEFAIFKEERLTYIDANSARDLVEAPIWDKAWNNGEGRSRYTGNSIDKILELTACSPFYIQIFCNELVRFMNHNKRRVATPADIAELTEKLTESVHGLGENDFENLMVAGDKELDDVKQEDAKAILKQIAIQTKVIPYCRKADVVVFGEEKDSYILSDLVRRTVIAEQERQSDRIKLQVQLFKYWLINHN